MHALLPSERCCLGVGKHIGGRTVHDDSPLEVQFVEVMTLEIYSLKTQNLSSAGSTVLLNNMSHGYV